MQARDGFCACDQAAFEAGEPFCGYCGGRIGSLLWQDADGDPIPPELPFPRPVLQQGQDEPVLAVSLLQVPGGKKGLLDTARLMKGGRLALCKAELVDEGPPQVLERKVEGLTIQVSFPAERGDERRRPRFLRLTFDLANAARQYVYQAAIQPEGLLIDSRDARYQRPSEERHAQLVVFWGSEEPIRLSFQENAPPYHLLPSIRAAYISGKMDAPRLLPRALASRDVRRLEIALSPKDDLQPLAQRGRESLIWLGLGTPGRVATKIPLSLQVTAKPELVIQGEQIFSIQFEKNSRWCTDGCAVSSRVICKNWDWDTYQLSVDCGDEEAGAAGCRSGLAQAAFFRAEVTREARRPAGRETSPDSEGALRLTAVLKPAWLYKSAALAGQQLLEARGTVQFKLVRSTEQKDRQSAGLLLCSADVIVRAPARRPLEALCLDFGTTNTASAVCFEPGVREDGESVQFGDQKILPTLLCYSPRERDGDKDVDLAQSRIGHEAITLNRKLGDSNLFISALKSDMLDVAGGRSAGKKDLTRTLTKSVKDVLADFLALYFKRLVTTPQMDGTRVKRLTFTYPVTAPDQYHRDVKEAVELAKERSGLPFFDEVQPLCDEATAGGLWWYSDEVQKTKTPRKLTLLVYDYGGGTTDISLMRFQPLAGGKVEVRIMGVAGMEKCGGTDLSWRLAREFVRCIGDDRRKGTASPRPFAPETRWGREIEEQIGKTTRDAWKIWCPSLIDMIEDVKVKILDTESLMELPEAVCLDLLAGASSSFLSQPLDFRGQPLELHDSRSAMNGRFCAARFVDYSEQDGQFSRAGGREPILGPDAWLLDLHPRDDRFKLLDEADQATKVALNMINKVLGPQSQVDAVLVIGQASRTTYFQHLLKDRLAGRALEYHQRRDMAKLSVSLGACVYVRARRHLILVPTLKKRVVHPFSGAFGQQRLLTAMRSDSELNRQYKLSAAGKDAGDDQADLLEELRQPSADIWFYMDWGFADDLLRDQNDTYVQLQCCHAGYSETSEDIVLVAADPDEEESFKDPERIPPEAAKLVLEAKAKAQASAGKLQPPTHFFLFWPEGEPDKAWLFAC